MTSVFLVSQGCYSDYRVVGIFSDEAVAEKMAALHTNGSVEEFTLDRYKDFAEAGLKRFFVYSQEGGSVEVKAVRQSDESLPEEGDGVVTPHASTLAIGPWMTVYVQARDTEHATKIAADKFREFKAVQP